MYEDLEGIVSVYVDAFSGPPWYESWEPQVVEGLFKEARSKEGFVCKVAYNTGLDKLVGFLWGYNVPSVDTETVAFSVISRELSELGLENKFYLAECAVARLFQGKGVGTSMLEALVLDCFVFRTINRGMVRAAEKAGYIVEELFKDPVYKDRKWLGAFRS